MVKEDILGGLELAVSKGVSLKKAMISFYKAGYSKDDIREAAEEFQKRNQSPVQKVQPTQNTQSMIPPQKNQTINTSEKSLQKKMNTQPNNKNSSENQKNIPFGNTGQQNTEKNQKNMPHGNPETSLSGNTQSKKITQSKKTGQNPPKPKKRAVISDYSEKKPDTKKYFIILYVFISVLIFIGVLTGLFIFKEEIIEFFKKILNSF